MVLSIMAQHDDTQNKSNTQHIIYVMKSNTFMLLVIMLNVVRLNVVAPSFQPQKICKKGNE